MKMPRLTFFKDRLNLVKELLVGGHTVHEKILR